MNKIGDILKDTRVKKDISLNKLSGLTKIKPEFLQRIENNDWENLPEYPVVSGFVKNIATYLDLPVDNTIAILRRDYIPKKLTINPKPDLDTKFVWSPKVTFFSAIVLLVIMVIGYLSFEYLKFIKPPSLTVEAPSENQVIVSSKVKVKGKTTTDVLLTANNQPIILDPDGLFDSEIDVVKGTESITFVAISRTGKRTEVNRKIKTDF